MESQAVAESIYLFSEQQEEVLPRTVQGELEQASKIRGYERRFRIFNGKYIYTSYKPRFSRPRKYWINLAILDPKPKRRFQIDGFMLSLTLFFAAITGVLFYLRVNPQEMTGASVSIPIILAALLLTMTSLAGLVYRFRCSVVFVSKYSRTHLLEFDHRKPNRSQLKDFISAVVDRIQRESWQDKGQQLAGELREHRRLRDEKSLDERSYQIAKERILKQHIKK